MKLTFLGACGTVTGSKTLVEAAPSRILVDCGLFQGLKSLRLRNWAPFEVEPASLDAVVLTHAHIDHSGYLPRLCKSGFRGPVWCTPGTRDLLRILLPDSAFLQEEQARHANKWGWSKHRPALPLYTREDADACLTRLRAIPFENSFEIAPELRAAFSRAGHIIGSACVRIEDARHSVTFSGDVGRPNDPIMRPPEVLAATDTLVVESTYGDRRHPTASVLDELATVLNDTFARGGTVLAPSFAVGRSQHLLHLVGQLRAAGRIPDVPVYLDSPMAIDATRIFCDNVEDHRIDEHACAAMCRLARFTSSPEESKAIDRASGPMLVISASGMATGGRILHHLRRFLPEPKNTLILVGFQAAGTRGRSLADGADEIKVHGDYVSVRAGVVQIAGLSAHADFVELIAWLEQSAAAPRRVFVTHGEPAAADSFRRRLIERFGWAVDVPRENQPYELQERV